MHPECRVRWATVDKVVGRLSVTSFTCWTIVSLVFVFSQAAECEPPLSGVRQVLCERRQPAEAPGLPPGDDEPARLQSQDVALLRLYCSLHTREWPTGSYGPGNKHISVVLVRYQLCSMYTSILYDRCGWTRSTSSLPSTYCSAPPPSGESARRCWPRRCPLACPPGEWGAWVGWAGNKATQPV